MSSAIKQSLYEILEATQGIEDVLTRLESGEIDNDGASEILYQALIAQDEALEQKVERYIRVIRNRQALAEDRKAEARHLAERAKVAENEADRLKKSLFTALETLGRTKMEAGPFTVSIQANGGVLPLIIADGTQVEDVPEAFVKTVVMHSIDNEQVRAKLEAGEELPFARLGERGRSLRIK